MFLTDEQLEMRAVARALFQKAHTGQSSPVTLEDAIEIERALHCAEMNAKATWLPHQLGQTLDWEYYLDSKIRKRLDADAIKRLGLK